MQACTNGNIGSRQRWLRVIGGLVLTGVAAQGFLAAPGPTERVALFLPLFGAAICFLQAQERT